MPKTVVHPRRYGRRRRQEKLEKACPGRMRIWRPGGKTGREGAAPVLHYAVQQEVIHALTNSAGGRDGIRTRDAQLCRLPLSL